MGEKPTAKEILAGTFVYPEETDYFTKAIMQETNKMFQHRWSLFSVLRRYKKWSILKTLRTTDG
jgi:hypothetical protein